MARFDLLILMGPPGSGKSHLAFAARKQEAMAFLEEAYRGALAEVGPPLAVETTGVSEREMILRLGSDHLAAFIRLDVTREVCVARVAGRPDGANLNNSAESARQFHDFWTREIAPAYRFDLVVNTEDSEAALAPIASLLA